MINNLSEILIFTSKYLKTSEYQNPMSLQISISSLFTSISVQVYNKSYNKNAEKHWEYGGIGRRAGLKIRRAL